MIWMPWQYLQRTQHKTLCQQNEVKNLQWKTSHSVAWFEIQKYKEKENNKDTDTKKQTIRSEVCMN